MAVVFGLGTRLRVRMRTTLENGDVTVGMLLSFSEVQNLTTSAHDLFVCMSVRMFCAWALQTTVDSQSCPIHFSTQAPLVQVVRDFDAAWLLPSEHVVLVVCQRCRCVLGAWTQWP